MSADGIGHSAIRIEGREKVTGRSQYVDDLRLPGMMHGVTVRSTEPRARITGIHFDPDFPWNECVVVMASDIPGRNAISLIMDDQPCLADRTVNHVEEPVLLIAHQERHLAEEARR